MDTNSINNIGFTHESQKSKTVEWYTPPWIFRALQLEFDLDPAYPEQYLPWIPVRNVYTAKDDGLSLPWSGLVFLNPPYGRETSKWLKKMHHHRNGIALVFSRTDCQWFHNYVTKADGILFLDKRVSFVDGSGETGQSGSGCGSILVAWGETSLTALKKMENQYGFFVHCNR